MVRDQAAVRLAGAGAAHQGAGRRAVRAAARLRRGARGGADHRRRAAAHAAADGARDQGPGHRPLRVDRVHLAQRRQGRPREVRGVRPRRPRVRRHQGRGGRRADRAPTCSRGASSPTWCPRRAVGRRPARGLAAVRRRCSTRSTGSSCRAPTSPPRPWSPAWSSSAGRSTTSRPTARCAPRRRPRRSARRSRAAASTRCCSRRPRRCATWSASPASRTPSTVIACIGPADGEDRRGARPAGRRARAERRRSPTLAEALAEYGSAARARGRWRPASRCCARRRSAPPRAAAEGRSDRAVPRRPAAPAAAYGRRCGGWSRETRLHPRDLVLPMFVEGGPAERRADRVDARRRAAHPATRCARRRPRRSRRASAG